MDGKYTADKLNILSDKELCDLVKNDCEPAFLCIISRYMGLLFSISGKYKYVQKKTGYDFDDFIQEGIIGLHSACISYDENKTVSFQNYAVICIEHRYTSIIRKINKKAEIPINSIVTLDEIPKDLPDDTLDNFQDDIELKEHLKELRSTMKSRLSTMEYEVARLYLRGLSYKEIAEKTGKNEKAVDNAMQRIRKKLSS